MASSNANTAGLLFVGVLALVLGRSIVNAPTRPPTDQGPMRPPTRPRPPVLPGPPLRPPGPGDDLIQPLPGDLKPGGYNDPFSTATWSTSDQPAVGGNPGSMVEVMEYDDPFIRKPRRDNVLGTYDVVVVAEQAPGDGEGNDPAPGPVAPGDPGLDPGGLEPGLEPGAEPGGDPGMIAGNIGGALQP